MSYKALYRKYRPASFDEVVGQEHVTTTLRNEIRADRIGHAYLLTGSRGTGKTSVAKIFAKAVNCENPENGNPCGTCDTCRAIAAGVSLNVIEIDAASNNGIADVRQIREETAYPPTEGRYKVYIIDEVHMLSQAAFNALLKTLEEPPAYVIFILATTEVQKIPVTILSRCQRFDFHRISQEEITGRLTDLFEREGVEAEERALRYIARKAEGGMRDALSLADQCTSFYLDQKITYENVLKLIGALDTPRLDSLLHAVCGGDVASVFSLLHDMVSDGRELSVIAADLTEHVRNILLVQTTNGAEDILDVTDEDMEMLRLDAEQIQGQTLIRYIRVLSEVMNQMRYAANKRIVLETALIRLARPQMETDSISLAERVRQLERALAEGRFMAAPAAGAPGSAAEGSRIGTRTGSVQTDAGHADRNSVPIVYEKAVPEDLQRIRDEWASIIGGIGDNLVRHALHGVTLQFNPNGSHEGEIYVVIHNMTGSHYAHDADTEALVAQAVEDRLQKKIQVHLVSGDDGSAAGRQTIETVDAAVRNAVHMDVEIEDDPGAF